MHVAPLFATYPFCPPYGQPILMNFPIKVATAARPKVKWVSRNTMQSNQRSCTQWKDFGMRPYENGREAIKSNWTMSQPSGRDRGEWGGPSARNHHASYWEGEKKGNRSFNQLIVCCILVIVSAHTCSTSKTTPTHSSLKRTRPN